LLSHGQRAPDGVLEQPHANPPALVGHGHGQAG
jgi:hypothetical protein